MLRRLLSVPLALALMAPLPAYATEGNILSVSPLTNVQSGIFGATALPGESVDFTLHISTTAPEPLRAFVATAVPRVNGGFSVSEDTVSGAAAWFSHEDTEFILDGEREETFSLTVPSGTPAGEYASGIVIETDYSPDTGGSTRTRIQQTVPVNIVVEGEETPEFSYGPASHSFRGANSAVFFEVENTGNRHVSPAGDVEILDNNGKTVSTAELVMKSVYTGTTGTAEVGLADALLPGDYFAVPVLTDAKSDATAQAKIPFTVEGTPEVGDEKNSAEVTQEQNSWMLPVIAGLLLVLILLVLILLVRRRKQ